MKKKMTGARWLTIEENGGKRVQEIGYTLSAVSRAIGSNWQWINKEYLAGRLPTEKWVGDGARSYWSKEQFEEIRKLWETYKQTKAATHHKSHVAKWCGVTQMVFDWAIKNGSIPAPTTTRGSGSSVYYTSTEFAEIKRHFERLRSARTNWVLLEVGLMKWGCTRADCAYVRKKPELLPKPVCVFGKTLRNKYYRLSDLEAVAALIKLRTIKPRKSKKKTKETN